MNNRFLLKRLSIAVISALMLQSCATGSGQRSVIGQSAHDTFNNDDPCANSKRNIGLAVGAIAGAVVGNQVAGKKNKALGTIIGAAAGAGIGGLIGSSYDKRQCEISMIEKKYNANIQVTTINTHESATKANSSEKVVGLSVNVVDMTNEPQFKAGSDNLSTSAAQMFNELANQYKVDPNDPATAKRRVLLIGHTDDTGNTMMNAALSERRAKNVANLFKSAGISESQIFYQGAGETMPFADNETEDGRNKNRRVEIVDLTDEDTFKLYLMNRRAKTEYYRPIEAINKPNATTPNTTANNTTKEKSKATIATKVAEKEKTVIDAKEKTVTNTKITQQQKAISTLSDIDFGGKPVTHENAGINIGKSPESKAKFSLISEANANDIHKISSCNLDRPRNTGVVKSLKDDKEFKTAEYLPGVYDSSWAGLANGHLIALTHVAVLRDGNTLARTPDLMIYQDYKAGSNVKASYKASPQVNVYYGDQAVLYRVFDKGPVQCLDMIIPNKNPKEAPNSMVYYGRSDSLYAATFNPKLAK